MAKNSSRRVVVYYTLIYGGKRTAQGYTPVIRVSTSVYEGRKQLFNNNTEISYPSASLVYKEWRKFILSGAKFGAATETDFSKGLTYWMEL